MKRRNFMKLFGCLPFVGLAKPEKCLPGRACASEGIKYETELVYSSDPSTMKGRILISQGYYPIYELQSVRGFCTHLYKKES